MPSNLSYYHIERVNIVVFVFLIVVNGAFCFEVRYFWAFVSLIIEKSIFTTK